MHLVHLKVSQATRLGQCGPLHYPPLRSSCSNHTRQHHSSLVFFLHLQCLILEPAISPPKCVLNPSPPLLLHCHPRPSTFSSCPEPLVSLPASPTLSTEQAESSSHCWTKPSAPHPTGNQGQLPESLECPGERTWDPLLGLCGRLTLKYTARAQ